MWQAKVTRLLVLGAQRIEMAVTERGSIASGSLVERSLSPTDESIDDVLGHVRAMWPVEIAASGAAHQEDWVVLISDRWLRWLSLPWSSNLSQAQSAAVHCRQQFAVAWGAESMESVFALDDAPYGEARLSVAMDLSLMDGLSSLARDMGGRLVLVQPLAVASWHWARRFYGHQNVIFTVAEEGEMTMFLAEAGRLRVAEVSGGPGLSPETVLRRHALRDPVWAEVDRGCYLDLGGMSRWDVSALSWEAVVAPGDEGNGFPRALSLAATAAPSSLDFVSRLRPRSLMRRGVLALSVLLAFVMVGMVFRNQSKMEHLEAELAARRVVIASAPSASDQRSEDARVDGANEAIRKLNVPVTRLLRAVQPPKDLRIALLGLDFSEATAEKPVLRITAEAHSSADMASYVGYLGDTRPFFGAYLVRHERTGSGESRPYRFSVEAPWKD